MKPTDDNEAPSDDTPIDDEEPFDVEIEIRRKRKLRRKRSPGREYASLISFAAWAIFTVIWLFFFASGYGLFQNIAVVFIALLIIGAFNALIWIPSVEGRKPKASAVSGILWIAFLIIWIMFLAVGFGFYENIGIALASFLIIGAVNILLWMPKHGDEGGARISAISAVGWLTFLVLWLPFADNFSASIYPINFYQSASIVLFSLLLMLILVIAPWRNKMQITIDDHVSVGSRPKATIGLLFLWILFLAIWMWIFAIDFSGYQNSAAVLFSFAIYVAITIGLWLPWARRRDEGPESWFSIGLAFAWVLTLALWFWFFADNFDMYQNLAIFLVSLLAMAAISGSAQWLKWHDFEAMDWED
ncbi:MAG: hypothetical protein JW779_10805 [Candidatus Thorarchaeota archaeon]|nr:hypothetical protein [Candidatus Thorarchaeota archaeon]